MPAGTQKERQIAVSTPLGDDVLLFYAMNGVEQIGRPFEFDVDLLSEDYAVAFDDLLGKAIAISVKRGDGDPRFFHGIVSRFAQVGQVGELAHYHATMRPWLWLLTRTTDCRIFQEMSVPDILKKIFKEYGFSDYDFKLNKSYGPWEYCVQYRETDFDFVSRLMEHEGIYYYHRHEEGKHILVVADAYGAHEKVPGNETVHYWPPTDNVKREEDWIWEWSLTREVQPVKVSLRDYDFTKPQADLTVAASKKRDHTRAEFEVYDFPGDYLETGDGDAYAKARLEAQQAQFETVRGVGNTRGFVPGGLFEIEGYPREDQNREHLITRASYDLIGDSYGSGEVTKGEIFTVRFSAIESQTPFRAPHQTPKPVVHGCQTATVVGPSGEEIYTDEYGRVKVHFHWDREDAKDDKSSCWIRVASVWAGTNWGGIQIPRIGQEVIVEFLEGDPDYPIITGRVYNADNMPPYGLPDNKTQSGIKSRSSKGGAAANFNEIRFEDKKGSEELYVHAEKNHTNITENDRAEDVGHDRTLHVGHDKSETIDNNKTIQVKVDHTEDIGANKTLTVGSNHDETIGANKTLSVGANHDETIGSNMTINVGANLTENVAAAYAESVGAAMALSVGAALAIDVGAAMATNVGAVNSKNVGSDDSESIGGAKKVEVAKDLTVTVEGGHAETVTKDYALKAKKIQIVADDEITIKTGDASISMKKNGAITIKGKDVTVEGSGKINVKASSDLILKGSKIAQN